MLSSGVPAGAADNGPTQGYIDALAKTGVDVNRRVSSYDANGRLTHQAVYGTNAARSGPPVASGVSVNGVVTYDAGSVGAAVDAVANDPQANANNNSALAGIVAAGKAALTAQATKLRGTANDLATKAAKAAADAAAVPASKPDLKDRATAYADRVAAAAIAADAAATKAEAAVTKANETTDGKPVFIYGDASLTADAGVQAQPTFHVVNEINYDRYDGAGNLQTYSVVTPGDQPLTATYTYTEALFDGYKDSTIEGTRSDGGPVGVTTDQYDVNGNLVGVTDTNKLSNDRSFVNDASGVVLQKTQEGNVLRQLVVGGEVFGTYGTGTDPDKTLNDDGSPNYVGQDDFNLAYHEVSSNYPTANAGTYTVKSGDTLQSIAQQVYGDSQLWYLIADANGALGALHAGQTLVLPNRVTDIHNNAGVFKPYDPTRVVGDTAPDLPPPAATESGGGGGGCGGWGQVLMVVVAVVVTIYTAGAAAESLFGTSELGALGAGEAATAGAIGGAAGSIASQAFGNVTGIQEGFSWKAVELGAVSGAVSMGMQSAMPTVAGLNPVGSAIVRGAVSSAMTQGIAVATGLQDKFSWRGVAAAAAGAGVGQAVNENLLGTGNDYLKTDFAKSMGSGIAAKIAGGTLSGFAAGLTTSVLHGGRVDVTRVATDAFGNALGSALGQDMVERLDSDPLGTFINRNSAAWAGIRVDMPVSMPSGAGSGTSGGLTPAQQEAMARGFGPLTDEAAQQKLASLGQGVSAANQYATGGSSNAGGSAGNDEIIDLGDGRIRLPSGRVVRPSVTVGPMEAYTPVDHRGDLAFGDPTTTMQWGAGVPGGEVKPLATQAIEGGTRYHYTDGYVDDLRGVGAKFAPQTLDTTVELLPGAIDAIQARRDYLASQGGNTTEQAQLEDYLARRDAAINAGDRATLRAAVNSDLAAYTGGNLSVGDRLYNLGLMLNPDSQWAHVPSMKKSLIQFGVTTATGVAGLMTGGLAFAALRGAGAGLIASGAGAGVTGDLATQALDNGVHFATNGQYGRSGINGTELALAGAGGALPGAVVATKEAYAGMRNTIAGVPDVSLNPFAPELSIGGRTIAPNSIDLQALRTQYGVNEANLQVEATFQHNGNVYYDVNQTARNPALATDTQLPIYSLSKAAAGAPNQTFASAHAEIGAMGQSFVDGN